MVYEPLYRTREVASINCFLVALEKEISQAYQYYLIVFNKTIILLALVGYEMIIANSALRASLASYSTRARGIIVNCFLTIRYCWDDNRLLFSNNT